MLSHQLSHLSTLIDEAFFTGVQVHRMEVLALEYQTSYTLWGETEMHTPMTLRVKLQNAPMMTLDNVIVFEAQVGKELYRPLDMQVRDRFLHFWSKEFPSAVERHRFYERKKPEPEAYELAEPHEMDEDDVLQG